MKVIWNFLSYMNYAPCAGDDLLSMVELAPDSEAHIQRHNLEGIPAPGMERECCSPGIGGADSAMMEVAMGSDSKNHQADLKKVVMTSPIIPRSFLSSLLHDGDHIIPEENKYVAQRRKRNRRTSVDTSNGQSSAMSSRRTKRIGTKRDFTRYGCWQLRLNEFMRPWFLVHKQAFSLESENL